MMQIPAPGYFKISRKSALWLGFAALLILIILVVGFCYRRFILSGLDLIAEATGGRSTALLCIALALLVLAFLMVWMLFPILVYVGLRNLSRRTAELDSTMKLCAQHLARAVDDRRTATMQDERIQQRPDKETL